MKFKIDENLPSEIAALLLHAGHDAMTVWEQRLRGEPDSRIAEVCQREERVLVTLDTDFANTHAYPPEQYAGIIVLRLRRQEKPYVLSAFRRVLPLIGSEQLARHVWIVEEGRVVRRIDQGALPAVDPGSEASMQGRIRTIPSSARSAQGSSMTWPGATGQASQGIWIFSLLHPRP